MLKQPLQSSDKTTTADALDLKTESSKTKLRVSLDVPEERIQRRTPLQRKTTGFVKADDEKSVSDSENDA